MSVGHVRQRIDFYEELEKNKQITEPSSSGLPIVALAQERLRTIESALSRSFGKNVMVILKNDRITRVSKQLLIRGVPYFRILFSSVFNDSNLPYALLKDIDINSFSMIQEYLRTGAVARIQNREYLPMELQQLLFAIDRLQICHMADWIGQQELKMTDTTVMCNFFLAYSMRSEPLMSKCVSFLNKKYPEVTIYTEGFRYLSIGYKRAPERYAVLAYTLHHLMKVIPFTRVQLTCQNSNLKSNDKKALIEITNALKAKLTHLWFSYCHNLENETVSKVLMNAIYLNSLTLKGCLKLKKGIFEKIGQECPGLVSLQLIGVPTLRNEELGVLVSKLPHLETLSLNCCWWITNEAVLAITESCPKIRELDLSLCERINDEAIKYLATKSLQLLEIDVFGCQGITDTGLQHLIDGDIPLEKLSLFLCGQVTPEKMRALFQAKDSLLRLSWCDPVEESMLILVK